MNLTEAQALHARCTRDLRETGRILDADHGGLLAVLDKALGYWETAQIIEAAAKAESDAAWLEANRPRPELRVLTK